MKKASITDAKNTFSALIDRVRAGASVLIVDRGRPVARIEPVHGDVREDGRLARLVRLGHVRPGRGALPRTVLAGAPPRASRDVSAVRVLLDERREGR